MPMFRVLFCSRESVRQKLPGNPPRWIVETEISFTPVTREKTKDPWCIKAETPDEAFAILKEKMGTLPGAISNLAVEPIPDVH